MKLSVIIVNYNVKHFLEQCLSSVCGAIKDGLAAEVIVVDNASSDGSVEYLQPKFKSVKFLLNKENTGFSKACNQGLAMAVGDFVLFLNPDTIVKEDCFKTCLDFFSSDQTIGAIGVKMIDGSGRFLKESKRSFPSPITAFYKLIGLARLFPSSKAFAAYHLGHLDHDRPHEVDVLAGAFMMIRRDVLEKTGGFDEVFFMYGEDIDLSYRIQKAGYKNYYFPDTSIIHFKGESTRRISMNYVRMFYTAMSVFVRKHYGGSKAGLFIFFIQIGIWLRGGLSAIAGFIRKIGLPLIDAALTIFSFWTVKQIWNEWVRPDTIYQEKMLWIAFPAFTFIYLLIAYYAGLYDRWYRRSQIAGSTLFATLVLLAAYSLLSENYRFSRGILVFGALLSLLLISVSRWLFQKWRIINVSKQQPGHADTIVVGTLEEYQEVSEMMHNAGQDDKLLGRVSVDVKEKDTLGSWNAIDETMRAISFREIIYVEGSLKFSQLIEKLALLGKRHKIKIHASGTGSIVGSDHKHALGHTVSVDSTYRISDPYNKRVKRLIDVGVAILGIITIPVQIFLLKKPLSFLMNCFQVLFGMKTWIGYSEVRNNLPTLRPAVLTSNGSGAGAVNLLPRESMEMVDYWYARDYEPLLDLRIIWRCFRNLGYQG